MKQTTGKRSEVEKAQRELNAIIGCTQSPEEFEASVQDRLQRMQAKPKAAKKRTLSANQSLFHRL